MIRARIVFTILFFGCSACVHSPPTYPGAGGTNLDPVTYTNYQCPNLSGRYEGVGVLVYGDSTAKQAATKRRMSDVFPYRDATQGQVVLDASRASDGRYTAPTYAQVHMEGRLAKIHLHFQNENTIEFASSFEDKTKFVCTGERGMISWGGEGAGGRSEFGPNRSDSFVVLRLDSEGNLLLERGMQVHMSLRFGGLPTGTAKYFAIYRFKRLP